MTITKTYSSWVRNRLDPDIRDRIRHAGEGTVEFTEAVGKPRGWVGCRVDDGTSIAWAAGPNPTAAWEAAMLEIITGPTRIVSLLS